MSAMKEYTLEIYKVDRRTKEGRRLVDTQDFGPSTRDGIEAVAQIQREQGFEVDVHETYVTKTNIISGAEFQERYDTPYFCSPSSETFWSN